MVGRQGDTKVNNILAPTKSPGCGTEPLIEAGEPNDKELRLKTTFLSMR